MYGYLRPDGRHGRTSLGRQQCALCHAFARDYRWRTRLLAGYDPSTLLMLIEAVRETPAPHVNVRCPLPPFVRRHALDPAWPGSRAVAALQLFLAGEKLFDDRVDRDSALAGLAERALSRDIAEAEKTLIELAQTEAGRASGFDLAAVRAHLRSQAALEADPCADLDSLASPTREALGQITEFAARVGGCAPADAAAGADFARSLGAIIYLVDAIDDVRRDLSQGSFNPIIKLFGDLTPHTLSELAALFHGRLADLSQRFAALPLRRHRRALSAATVASLERRGAQALRTLPVHRSTLRLAGVIS